MDDRKKIVSEMTVTISEHVTQAFRQNKVDCRQFLENNSSAGSYTVEEVSGTYQLIGSYEGMRQIRKELIKTLMTFATTERHLQAHSLQNATEIERRMSNQMTHDHVKTAPSTSHKGLQGNVVDSRNDSTQGQLTQEGMSKELSAKQKRVRKLKSPIPDDDTSVDADAIAQRGLAEMRADDGPRILDENTRKLVDSGEYVCIEVDRERHDHLMTHYKYEMKNELPTLLAFDDEYGKHSVAFKSSIRKKGGEDGGKSKYLSYLSRFGFEVGRVPDSIDGSVLSSLVTTRSKDKDLSFVLNEANKIYKLIGKKNEVERMKKLIDEHIKTVNERLKMPKDLEENTWTTVQGTSRKDKKTTSSILYFTMEQGKLNRCETSQMSTTKNRSLQVSLSECKTKVPTADAIVRAVDSKMKGVGDAKAALPIDSNTKYKEECRKIVNEHHGCIPVGKVVHIQTTADFQQKTKIKYIVHVVLKEKSAPASVATIKDAIYCCLQHADNGLKAKSVTFPHLGGSDYCDIGSFARGAIEALQSLTPTSLQRVNFVLKDSKTLGEVAAEFERNNVHCQHKSQLAPSSESSYKDHSTSL